MQIWRWTHAARRCDSKEYFYNDLSVILPQFMTWKTKNLLPNFKVLICQFQRLFLDSKSELSTHCYYFSLWCFRSCLSFVLLLLAFVVKDQYSRYLYLLGKMQVVVMPLQLGNLHLIYTFLHDLYIPCKFDQSCQFKFGKFFNDCFRWDICQVGNIRLRIVKVFVCYKEIKQPSCCGSWN